VPAVRSVLGVVVSVSIAEVSVDSRIGSQVVNVATADIRSGVTPVGGAG
jgi:hypothetical protein